MSSGDDYQTIWLPNEAMRERAQVPSTTRDALDAVQGFMRTRYREQRDDGTWVAELWPDDLQRVAEGYGCANAHCLAHYNRRFQTCPLCGEPMGAQGIVEYSPDYWQPYEGRTSGEILSESL